MSSVIAVVATASHEGPKMPAGPCIGTIMPMVNVSDRGVERGTRDAIRVASGTAPPRLTGRIRDDCHNDLCKAVNSTARTGLMPTMVGGAG